MTHRPIRRRRGPGAQEQGSGVVDWTHYRRVTVFLKPGDFEKIRSRAVALEVGNSIIARDIIEAWCAGEPPPIFIGTNERS